MSTKASDAIAAALQKELDAMLDPLDIPRSWPSRQLNDYESKRALLARRIHTIRSEAPTVAHLDEQIASNTEWKGHLAQWRASLLAELDALPRATTPEQFGTRQNLLLSMSVIDGGGMPDNSGYALETVRLGALMRESGYTEDPPQAGQTFGRLPWFGALPEVELRIKDLTARRDAAQLRLDDALLDDADREQRAKDDLARTAVLNAQPQRKTRGDGSQYDKFPDGRVVEVTVTT